MKRTSFVVNSSLAIISKVFAVCALLALLVHVMFMTDADLFVSSDYISFLTGATIVSSGRGSKLFDYSTQLTYQKEIKHEFKDKIKLYPEVGLDRAMPFRNLPFVALVFLPFTMVSPFLSFKLFMLFNITLLLFFLWRIKTKILKDWTLDRLILLSLLFLPVLTSIVRGQLTIVALFLLYMSYENIKSKRDLLAGVIAGLLAIKAQYLFALPFLVFLVSDFWKFTKSFLFTLAILGVLSILVSGVGIFSYPGFLWLTEQAKYGSVPTEILTVFSLLRMVTGNPFWALFINSLIYLIVIFLFLKFKKMYSLEVAFGITILSVLLFGMHMTDNEVVLLLLPFLLMLKIARKKRWAWAFIVSGIFATYLRLTPFAFWEIAVLIILLIVLFFKGKNGDRSYVYG